MRVPRRLSMTERGDFARVRRDGKSVAGRFLLLAILPDESLEHLKLGIITTRKIGKAVARNKIRRRLRGIVSKHGDRIVSPCFMVMVARHRAGAATFPELEKEWLRLAERLGIVPKPA
ncbi:MAG: ribonuclease P protein component [Akkermansiaceae bacterium]|nr:ribonuclease P protein component [Akkermansiaceae bacterium]NNM28519.1 ribonuclease P protein component [Akkermansiaceae bacterium]